MPPSDLERIFAALAGNPRFTADLDLALALDDRNVETTLTALEGLGHRPRAALPLRAFADPEQRADWVEPHDAGRH